MTLVRARSWTSSSKQDSPPARSLHHVVRAQRDSARGLRRLRRPRLRRTKPAESGPRNSSGPSKRLRALQQVLAKTSRTAPSRLVMPGSRPRSGPRSIPSSTQVHAVVLSTIAQVVVVLVISASTSTPVLSVAKATLGTGTTERSGSPPWRTLPHLRGIFMGAKRLSRLQWLGRGGRGLRSLPGSKMYVFTDPSFWKFSLEPLG